MENILEFTGLEPGPTSMVLVGVHGDERCGVEALARILPSLRIARGRVFFACGNPRAIKMNARFAETNLNRMFRPEASLSEVEKKSYEYARAGFLKKYLDQAGALLDVHASFTPDSHRFVICEPNGFGITAFLPVDLVVSGFDAVEPGGTDYYMNRAGRIGICLECGYLKDPSSTRLAEKGIYAFLAALGHLGDAPLQCARPRHVRMYQLYLTRTDNFVLREPFSDFTELPAGTLIGRDGREDIRTDRDSVILFARDRHSPGEEAFLLGEYVKGPA